MTIYLTASLALLLLAQLALDLTVLLRLVLKKPAHRTSEEVEKAILDLGIPTDGAVRVRAIREDPKVFEKVKAAARLRVAVEETGGIDNFLILAGLSCEAQRQHAGILAAALLANGTVIGGALALYFGFGTLGGVLLGANLGACGVALFSLLILVLRVKTTQRMIALSLPPFVQQIIAVIVGGYDIETGLRLLVQLYESRGIRNRLVDALTEIAAVTQSTGALLPALRSRAGLLGEENLRRVLASLARGHEHGTSIVKELQDIVRSLAPPGRALGGIAYLSQPLPRFTALAGLPFDALSFRVIQCGLFAAGIATGFAAHMSSTSIMLLAAFCAALPYLFGLSKIRSRRLEFESEFPFFVGQLTALLRGGDDTITALQKVNQYCSESSAIRIQVELLLESLAAGEDEGEATVAFALDVPSPGAEQLAISFALSRMVPGKLCHMLEQAVMAVRATS